MLTFNYDCHKGLLILKSLEVVVNPCISYFYALTLDFVSLFLYLETDKSLVKVNLLCCTVSNATSISSCLSKPYTFNLPVLFDKHL